MTSGTKSAVRQIAIASVFLVGLLMVGQSLAQDARGPLAPQKSPTKGSESLLELVLKGGYVMIPLGLCSILALAITVERFISLRRQKMMPPEFLEGLKETVSGVGDAEQGMLYCEERVCPISNVFMAGINRIPQGDSAVEKAIEDAGAKEVHKMKRSLRPLSVIATVSPLLGLLGTVYGMITAFQAASAMGVGKADTLAVGIYEALVTTAAGLTLAIPVVIVYQILCGRVDALVDYMDDQAIEFIEHVAYGRKGRPARQQVVTL